MWTIPTRSPRYLKIKSQNQNAILNATNKQNDSGLCNAILWTRCFCATRKSNHTAKRNQLETGVEKRCIISFWEMKLWCVLCSCFQMARSPRYVELFFIQSQIQDDQPDNIQPNYCHVTTILGALLACLISHVNRLLFCGLVACMPSKFIMTRLNEISWKRIYKQDV